MIKAEPLRKLFGRRIRQLRKQRGMSQEQLALRAGLDPSFVGMVERGEKAASLTTVEKLAHALNITYLELFDFTTVRDDNESKERIKETFYTILNDNSLKDMLTVALDNIVAFNKKRAKARS